MGDPGRDVRRARARRRALAISGPGLVFGVFAAFASCAPPRWRCPAVTQPARPRTRPRAPGPDPAECGHGDSIATRCASRSATPAVRARARHQRRRLRGGGRTRRAHGRPRRRPAPRRRASTAAWLTACTRRGRHHRRRGRFCGLVGRRLAPALVLAAVEYRRCALAVIGARARRDRSAVAMLFAAGVGQAVAAIASNSLLPTLRAVGVGRRGVRGPGVAVLLRARRRRDRRCPHSSPRHRDRERRSSSSAALVPVVVAAPVARGLAARPRRDGARSSSSRCCAACQLFRGLPAPSLEGLARNAEPVDLHHRRQSDGRGRAR